MNTYSSPSFSPPLSAHEHHNRKRLWIGIGIAVIVILIIAGAVYYMKRQRDFGAYYDAVMAAEREAAFQQLSESDAKPLSDADRAKVFEVLVNAGGEGLSDADRAQAFADLEAGEKLRRQEIKQQYKDLP